MAKKRPIERPKNLNLFTIRLPINAMVSIAHRVSGVVLFLLLPLFILVYRESLHSEASFANLSQILQGNVGKCALWLLAVPFFHHFYAGLRHLGQDVHWMTSLTKARLSGKLVFALDAITAVLFGVWLWC